MFRVLNPNSKECLVFCFSKNCLSPHFSTPPSKNNVSGRGDPRRGGANSRVQRSPQGRVERSGLFYLFYYIMALEMSSSRLVRRHGVVSFFLSFIVSFLYDYKKFHRPVFVQKADNNILRSSLHSSRFSILTAPTMRFGAFYSSSSSSSFKPPLLFCAGS